MYSTFERASQEALKLRLLDHEDVTMSIISTDTLAFDTIPFDERRRQVILADDGFKATDGTPLPVMFTRAKDLIEMEPGLGLQDDDSVKLGAEDVWFAVEWIPEDLVASVHRGNNDPVPEDVLAQLRQGASEIAEENAAGT